MKTDSRVVAPLTCGLGRDDLRSAAESFAGILRTAVEPTSVLDEFSPYWFTHPTGFGRWTWSDVLGFLVRGRSERRLVAQLPRNVQGRAALIGLSIGLAFRQLALNAMERRQLRMAGAAG